MQIAHSKESKKENSNFSDIGRGRVRAGQSSVNERRFSKINGSVR